MTHKKLKYGGFSLLMTFIFLAGIVLLNILATMLTERFYLKADLTLGGLYSLSDEASEFLTGLSEDIEITVLAEESAWKNDMRKTIGEILQNYSAVSGGRISVSYINPDLNPQIKTQYPDLSGLNSDDIIVASAKRAKAVPVANLFTVSSENKISGIKADQELVASLLYVTNEKVAQAVFLTGHNEKPSDQLWQLLEKNGYECVSANIALEEIPEDATIVVSNAPSLDFISLEIDRLEKYLLAGGNAMIFYDYETYSLPLLDMYLEEWGVAVEPKLVLDEYNYFYQMNFIAALVKTPVNTLTSLVAAEDAGAYVGMYNARPVKKLWASGNKGRRDTGTLLETYPSTSYAKLREEGIAIESAEKAAGDEAGPFTLGTVTRQTSYDTDGSTVYSHMLVSSSTLIDDTILTNYGSYFYNKTILSIIAGDLNPFGQSVYIPTKEVTGGQLTIMVGQTRAVLVLLVIVLPLTIIVAGIVVWRRRKHL